MQDWLSQLSKIRSQSERIVLGVMSGTSMDAVDVALCRIAGAGLPSAHSPGAKVTLVELYTHTFDTTLRERASKRGSLTLAETAELSAAFGELFGNACHAACEAASRHGLVVDLIGSHGQTVYHHSRLPNAARVSLQLGDGDRIAERTGLPVFFDFRARDLAAGGEGAPLTPYADVVLFGGGSGRAILNLGGIANITVLHADSSKIIGFDTGPANAPLDRLARALSGGTLLHDTDGKLARSGKVNASVLKKLLKDDHFLQQVPPKSTGFEMYGDTFVEQLVALHGSLSVDVIATATEFVASTIADAVKRFVQPHVALQEIVVAGGGGRNAFLIERMAMQLAPVKVRYSDELGVPAHAREAMAFALFANDALCGVPTSLPSVTGAQYARVLGKLAFPS